MIKETFNAAFIAVPYLYKNALARACFAYPAEGGENG